MTFEELKQNKELFEQCGKEIEANVQAGKDPVSAAVEVLNAHDVEVDEDAIRAAEVEKLQLSQEEMDHVSGGTDNSCWSDYACHYIYHHDGDGKVGEDCFNNYECNLTVHCDTGSFNRVRRFSL